MGKPKLLALYVGEGTEREQCHLLCSLPPFSHFLHYPQANWAVLVLIPGGLGLCASRTLRVSPTNSPVRLGVSPTASTPTVVFNQRFEALFPHAGALGCVVYLAPSCFSQFICTQMWDCPLHQPLPRRSTSRCLARSPLCLAAGLRLSCQTR